MQYWLSTSIYMWKGIDKQGLILEGELRSFNRYLISAQLLKLDIQPIKIVRRIFSFRVKKILTPALRIQFTEQLADLIGSGIPLTHAVLIVSQSFSDRRVKTLFWFIHRSIEWGHSFGKSLQDFTQEFNAAYRQLVEIGEISGGLEKVLYRLAELERKKILMIHKFQKASAYPVLVLVLTFAVSGFLLLEIVPQFGETFNQAHVDLPWITAVLLQCSNFILYHGFFIIFFGIGIIVLCGYFFEVSQRVKKQTSRWLLRCPYFGKIISAFYLMHFSYGLSNFLQAGVSLPQALETMVKQATNPLYIDAIMSILSTVRQGQSLSQSLRSLNYFPVFFVDTLRVGEESGLTGQSLLKLANFYESNVDRFLENASLFVEPVLMLILGLIVGLFMLALYLPIFNLGHVING